MKQDLKQPIYEMTEGDLLVPVYRHMIDPNRPGDYGKLEVIALASLSNPSEPLERIFSVS